MKKRYLVASADESVSDWAPMIVLAEHKAEAIDRYLRLEYSRDPIFRQSVLSPDGSFIEKFIIVSPADNHSFETTGRVEYNPDIVRSRVMAYFDERTDLGERFVRYMETRDALHLNEELFEFISATDPDGIVALALDEIRQL